MGGISLETQVLFRKAEIIQMVYILATPDSDPKPMLNGNPMHVNWWLFASNIFILSVYEPCKGMI